MRNKFKSNPFLRVFTLLLALLVVVIITAIGLFYYVFSIPEPEGLSPATWPSTFTNNFSAWVEVEDEKVIVREYGLARLDEYGLWIQIIDENGHEVFAHNKPEQYPVRYSASELIAINASDYAHGSTVFASSFQESNETYSYIIGFPYNVGKYSLYYNGERLQRLSPAVSMMIYAAFAALVLLGLGYGLWLSRKMSKITGGIGDISLRAYQPLKESGTFREIYTALNRMDAEIRSSDKLREDTERARKEWIANITHDLKTPLSPIKGYAELLAGDSATEAETAREYGAIILKNAAHAEKLMNDLKLTYQLDSGAIPYHPKKIRLTRYLKEMVIDIVNDPAFSGRDIQFESGVPEMEVRLDPDLFRRAFQNLVINALVHNAPDTKVEISVDMGPQNTINICIRDNGAGMTEAEQAQLFERYYRGTSTKERPEGSGLGLAIARQIVALNGGGITVESKPNEGAAFVISIPATN